MGTRGGRARRGKEATVKWQRKFKYRFPKGVYGKREKALGWLSFRIRGRFHEC
jgi:hypothetical protein